MTTSTPSALDTWVAPRTGPSGIARAINRVSGLIGMAIRIRREQLGAEDPAELRRARAQLGQRVCRALAAHHGVELRVRGSLPEGPVVMVANHLGYLDPLILGGLRPSAAIAKREASTWPLLGPAMAKIGMIFVDRGCPYSGMLSLRNAARTLDAGVSVLVFPEGTTTYGDEVLPFHRGIFGIAARKRVPVVPIGIRFADRAMCWVGDVGFAGHYAKLASRRRIVLDVLIGEGETLDMGATAGAAYMRGRVDSLRRRLIRDSAAPRR